MHQVLIGIGVCILVLCFLLYGLCKVRSQRKYLVADLYPRLDNLDEIQSGDLLLCHHRGKSTLLADFIGSQWTHVALCHRDLDTNQLYLIESCIYGMRYSTLDLQMREYFGDLHVRKLKQPLTQDQCIRMQDIVDRLMLDENQNYPGESIFIEPDSKLKLLTFDVTADKTEIDYNSSRANLLLRGPIFTFSRYAPNVVPAWVKRSPLCTDLAIMMLRELGVVNHPIRDHCTDPNAFNDFPYLHELYGTAFLLKSFSEHDVNAFPEDERNTKCIKLIAR